MISLDEKLFDDVATDAGQTKFSPLKAKRELEMIETKKRQHRRKNIASRSPTTVEGLQHRLLPPNDLESM